MTPTNKLRFVRRPVQDRTFGDGIVRYERILQQWWAAEGWEHQDTVNAGGEWQDIPVENEE